MTGIDEGIRGLVRLAPRDPDACLKLARTLERAGQTDQVIPGLLLGRDHEVARAALREQWSRRAPPQTEWVDVLPVREPRARWVVKLDGRDPIQSVLWSPLGVACRTTKRLVVLDPATGAVRHELPKVARATLAGDVVIATSSRVVSVHDLWTGERLVETRLQGATESGQLGGALFVTGGKAGVHAHDASDPGKGLAVRWSRKGDYLLPACQPHSQVLGTRLESLPASLVATDLVALAGTNGGLEVVNAAGETRWRLEGPVHASFADEAAVLVARQDGAFACHDAVTGKQLWASPAANAVALARAAVIVQLGPARFGFLDRASGELLGTADLATGEGPTTETAFQAARDVGYAILTFLDGRGAWSRSELVAFTAGGVLWRRAPTDDHYLTLAAGDGCLVAASSRAVACLEEASRAALPSGEEEAPAVRRVAATPEQRLPPPRRAGDLEEALLELPVPRATSALAVSPDGKHLALGSRKTIALVDHATGKPDRTWPAPGPCLALSFAPGSDALLSTCLSADGQSRTLTLRDLDGTVLGAVEGPAEHAAIVRDRLIAWLDRTGTVQLTDVATRESRILARPEGTRRLHEPTFSARGSIAAAGCLDETRAFAPLVALYDLDRGAVRARIEERASALLVGPDVVILGGTGFVSLHDAQGRLDRRIELPEDPRGRSMTDVLSLALSSGDRLLLVGRGVQQKSVGNNVRLVEGWLGVHDLASGELVRAIRMKVPPVFVGALEGGRAFTADVRTESPKPGCIWRVS